MEPQQVTTTVMEPRQVTMTVMEPRQVTNTVMEPRQVTNTVMEEKVLMLRILTRTALCNQPVRTSNNHHFVRTFVSFFVLSFCSLTEVLSFPASYIVFLIMFVQRNWTPLHAAVSFASRTVDLSAVELLISASAAINARDGVRGMREGCEL
jgi:hypothetical protein